MTNTELSGGDAVLRVAVLEQQVAALEAEKARGFLPDGFAAVPIEQLTGMMSHNDHDTRVQAERHLLAALDITHAPAAPDVDPDAGCTLECGAYGTY